MKALSIHPIWVEAIIGGQKTVECRTWKTDYRGDILICSTAKKFKGTIPGHAQCVVNLVDIVPFTKNHLAAACMDKSELRPGMYAWMIDNVRLIRPIPLKGKLSLWTYDGDIEYLPETETDEEDQKQYDEIFAPLMV